MHSVSLEIVSVEVTAKPRKLRMRKVVIWRGKKMCFIKPWTVEFVQDIETQHGLDVEAELCRFLQEEIRKEAAAGYAENNSYSELLANKIKQISSGLANKYYESNLNKELHESTIKPRK